MTTRSETQRSWYLSDWFAAAVLAIAYIVTARFSLSMGAVAGVAAPVWPPTGLSLAALVILGSRLWPGVAAGAFLANWSVGMPVLAAAGASFGNTLEALLGSFLLRRSDFRPSLERLRDVLALVVFGAGLSTLVSATIGASSAWLGGVLLSADYANAWWTWWVGDAMGDLVVASALLIFWSERSRVGRPTMRWLEAGAFVVTVLCIWILAFRSGWRLPGFRYLGAYVVFPFVIFAALRFAQRGVAVTIVVISVLAIWSTVNGLGPFSRANMHDSLLYLQAFMSIVSVTALVMGAVITERRRAEAALRESEERYRRLIEISPDAVMLIALDGTLLLCNEQAVTAQGYTRDELRGRTAVDLLAVKDRPRASKDLRTALETGSISNVEYEMLRKDGTTFPVELSASVPLDHTAKAQGFIAVWRDITARKQAEAAVQRMAAIVESSSDAIIGKTLEGTVTSWNAGAEQMYGYSSAEMIGAPVARLAPAESAAEFAGILAKIQRGERIREHETVRVRKDGRTIHVSLTISPIRDAAGTIIGASTITRDISDRKALERLRADFIASLTHDIRGPVGNIGGYLELLRDEKGLRARTREIIAGMESSVQTIFSLVTNYLDGARLEAGRFSLTKKPVAINELLTRVVRQYEVVGEHRGVTVDLQLCAGIPPVEADELALERVFANLVHNAFKFSPDGGRITVSTLQEDRWAVASVADSGPGIPVEDIHLLFERYRQTAAGGSQLGTGLGLFIAKSLTEAHGGVIQVTSDARGSCFTVRLPLVRAAAASASLAGRIALDRQRPHHTGGS